MVTQSLGFRAYKSWYIIITGQLTLAISWYTPGHSQNLVSGDTLHTVHSGIYHQREPQKIYLRAHRTGWNSREHLQRVWARKGLCVLTAFYFLEVFTEVAVLHDCQTLALETLQGQTRWTVSVKQKETKTRLRKNTDGLKTRGLLYKYLFFSFKKHPNFFKWRKTPPKRNKMQQSR